MKRNGSILIFMTWILLLLVVLTASVAFRSRLAAKLSAFYGERLSNAYRMHSAVNLASYFVSRDDDPETDSALDSWYGKPRDLKNFALSKQIELSIADEESKMNLNKVTPVILQHFFEVLKENNVALKTDPKDIITSIVAWRSGGSTLEGKTTLGFEHKRAPFESVDELRLIQYITPEDMDVLKPFFTVYGKPFDFSLRVNINTVHDYILKAVIESVPMGDSDRQLLLDRIRLVRKGDPSHPEKNPPAFFRTSDLQAGTFMQKLLLPNTPEMINATSQLLQFFVADSQYFLVHAETKQEEFPLVVEGGLGLREPVLVRASRGNYSLQPRLNNALNGYPLEILSWKEQVIR